MKLKPGDIVIQNGANSQVGKFVIQFAKTMGMKTVNIVRDPKNKENPAERKEKIDDLKKLGAGSTFYFCHKVYPVINSLHILDFVFFESEMGTNKEGIIKELGGSKPCLALNCIAGKSGSNLAEILGESGVLVTYGS